jgi:hypothetical protein
MPRLTAKPFKAHASLESWAWSELNGELAGRLTPEQFQTVFAVAMLGGGGSSSRRTLLLALKEPSAVLLPKKQKKRALPLMTAKQIPLAWLEEPNSQIESFAHLLTREPLAVLRIMAWVQGYNLRKGKRGAAVERRTIVDVLIDATPAKTTPREIAYLASISSKTDPDNPPMEGNIAKARQRRRKEIDAFEDAKLGSPEQKQEDAFRYFSKWVAHVRAKKRAKKRNPDKNSPAPSE